MHIYLLRHGQSYVNLPDWDGDNWDQPLTELGQKQAQLAASWVSENLKFDTLFASTLRRTQETAQYISEAIGLDVCQDEGIREVGTNQPDGKPLSSVKRYFEGIWGTQQPYDALTEHGENWMQFRSRVGIFIERQTRAYDEQASTNADDSSILVVCHGGVIEAFFEYVFAKGPWSVVSVVTRNTGITHLEYRPVPRRPAWRLHYHNRLEHLPPDLVT